MNNFDSFLSCVPSFCIWLSIRNPLTLLVIWYRCAWCRYLCIVIDINSVTIPSFWFQSLEWYSFFSAKVDDVDVVLAKSSAIPFRHGRWRHNMCIFRRFPSVFDMFSAFFRLLKRLFGHTIDFFASSNLSAETVALSPISLIEWINSELFMICFSALIFPTLNIKEVESQPVIAWSRGNISRISRISNMLTNLRKIDVFFTEEWDHGSC